ncbi:hypothetical protein BDZ45DRAFT_812071 [Acephala macrosclerotiorum]|nr:hypothetical protein BDZ45DRAFT_812071 [Acephala macrosclerotiorum]
MLNTTVVNIISYFYPIGNTPPVCLTQDIPPGEDVDILLLGCGDARNILFTTSCHAAPIRRRLDITCCDLEPAILARNIILFTLLIDDLDGKFISEHWQIYYHMFLDQHSSNFLEAQAAKLVELSGTMETWDSGTYGGLIRFCDRGSLVLVRDVWSSYRLSGMDKNQRSDFNANFARSVTKSLEHKKYWLGSGTVSTGLRSAAPTSFQALPDLRKLHQYFWDHGSTDKKPPSRAQDKIPNPMFISSSTEPLTVHYGIDPHLGFPLATAYAPLVLEVKNDLSQHSATKAARDHFAAWSRSFRSFAEKHLILRFVTGDAIAFCHSLQQQRSNPNIASNWYRTRYHMEPLNLDGSGVGPLSFDLIDSSNLFDHVGPLNLLVAAAPLLKTTISATMYTESLVAQDRDRKELRARMLCGHFPTMSILLGLVSAEYWTNATATSSVEENLMDIALGDSRDTRKGQMFCRIGWKCMAPTSNCTAYSKVHFKPADLASIIHQVYRNMFRHEDVGKFFSNLKLSVLYNNSNIYYHRGTLVALLKLVKSRVVVDWSDFMDEIMSRIERDTTIIKGMNYIQELYVQLQLQDVYTMPAFRPNLQNTLPRTFFDGVGSWQDKPPAICVTLLVPRSSLGAFTSLQPLDLGTPILQTTLQSRNGFMTRTFNAFAELQLGFGTVKTVGERTDPKFKIIIDDDPKGWLGNSPVIVSFYVPTIAVLVEPEDTLVSLAIQATPMSTHTFMPTLGMEMNVFQALLKDKKNVFITKHSPSQMGYRSVGSLSLSQPTQETIDPSVTNSMISSVDNTKSMISTLTGRLDFLSHDLKKLLLDGAAITIEQSSPFVIKVNVGDSENSFNLVFPVPVSKARTKTRIARKFSYIEVISSMADHVTREGLSHFICPAFLTAIGPVIWNMPYLNLETLSVLDITKTSRMEWLTQHTSLQMSDRERTLRGGNTVTGPAINSDLRVNYKESLFSIFMQYTGLQGPKGKVFILNKPLDGGGHIIILVSSLRLDLANHTVVLDCAIIPLTTDTMSGLRPFLTAMLNASIPNVMITVDNDELTLWREILPSLVERCRQWEHEPTCEYKAKAKIPLSTEDGEHFLCSCGMGKFPETFITGIPKWDVARKYAARAAISPCFSVPYVEQNFQGTELKERLERIYDNKCQVCQRGKTQDGTTLLRCERCRFVKYCSKECQRMDWKEHKKGCKPLPTS